MSMGTAERQKAVSAYTEMLESIGTVNLQHVYLSSGYHVHSGVCMFRVMKSAPIARMSHVSSMKWADATGTPPINTALDNAYGF